MSVSSPPSKPTSENQKLAASGSERSTTASCNKTEPVPPHNELLTAPKTLALLVLALIPFWAVPIAHLCSNPQTATGFFHYELPYYVANGRAAFERGNGVLYPNPYDASAQSPAIYAHWLPWTLGLLTSTFSSYPGDVIIALTLFASLLFAWSTRELVLHRIGPNNKATLAFLLAMWGGGLLTAIGSVRGIFQTDTWIQTVLQFDPGNGMWFLNWGRNALFPTEAIYHSIVGLCWLSEIRQRHRAANGLLLLLGTTHPWSGIELLLTINAWRFFELIYFQDRRAINQVSISAVMLAVFLGYYKVWLPAFAEHAQLQNVWELNWSVPWSTALLAYALVLAPATLFVTRKWRSVGLNRTERFLLCALFIAAGLAFHDRLIKPVQPIHFTRGYVWMPLFLLSLPALMDSIQGSFRASRKHVCVMLLLTGVFISDNLVFAIVHCHRQSTLVDGFHLDTDERALFTALHQSAATTGRIAITESETLNYLLPAYANVRPWLGHKFNTPEFPERKTVWEHCFLSHHVSVEQIPSAVDLVIVRRSSDSYELASTSAWSVANIPNAEWLVWQRIK